MLGSRNTPVHHNASGGTQMRYTLPQVQELPKVPTVLSVERHRLRLITKLPWRPRREAVRQGGRG